MVEEAERHFPHFLQQCALTLRLMAYWGAEDQEERLDRLKCITEYLQDRSASVQNSPSCMDYELRNFTIASRKFGEVEQLSSCKFSQQSLCCNCGSVPDARMPDCNLLTQSYPVSHFNTGQSTNTTWWGLVVLSPFIWQIQEYGLRIKSFVSKSLWVQNEVYLFCRFNSTSCLFEKKPKLKKFIFPQAWFTHLYIIKKLETSRECQQSLRSIKLRKHLNGVITKIPDNKPEVIHRPLVKETSPSRSMVSSKCRSEVLKQMSSIQFLKKLF